MLDRITAAISMDGPLRFSDYVGLALYDPVGGFYQSGGAAGRRGDFVTSPEVGPLFGACVAHALDALWEQLNRPESFTFVDAGAGPGTLARSILAAQPACLEALDYVAVEVSAAQRERHPDGVTSTAEMPTNPVTGLVFANELLDNLGFDIAECAIDGWREVRVSLEDGSLGFVLGDIVNIDLPTAAIGSRVPIVDGAQAWLARALGVLERGQIVVVDYGASTDELASRGGWLRTYRDHERGSDALLDPGYRDITIDVPFDQLDVVQPPTSNRSQAEFLRSVGRVDELVAKGKAIWAERAGIGDLAAIKARSRVSEAEALLDPAGLGGFRVLEWLRL